MKQEVIQTLHPLEGKTNKKIALVKYNFIRENLLMILAENELPHTELMEELYALSNGFRAPSIHQRYFSNTSTQFYRCWWTNCTKKRRHFQK